MPTVCLYFQLHQPFRLRHYSAFDSAPSYFDDALNAQLVRRIADRCYVPMNRLLLDLIRIHAGRFRLALSITGTALEQFESYAPEVLQGLHALAQTRCVEFLGETFHHSLASLHSDPEFRAQVELHRRMIRRLFAQTPAIFRNTELIYSNRIAALAAGLGFRGILAEGWEAALNNRSAAFIYRTMASRALSGGPAIGSQVESPENGGGDKEVLYLLLRNHRLSDAISYRFADPRAPEFPLTEDKFAALVSQIGGRLCNLFMDYETFGEHQPESTGIFDFLRALPAKLLAQNSFATPGELLAPGDLETAGELDVPSAISWADEARDLGAWMGNAMQQDALAQYYALEEKILAANDPRLLSDWRKLGTSDHFYYMSTKEKADGGFPAYFRHYDSPYDAYINFMNVLDHLASRTTPK